MKFIRFSHLVVSAHDIHDEVHPRRVARVEDAVGQREVRPVEEPLGHMEHELAQARECQGVGLNRYLKKHSKAAKVELH